MPLTGSPVTNPWRTYANVGTPTSGVTSTGSTPGYTQTYNPLTPPILDPNWGPAVYDTEKRGAELAVGGGYAGSPLAGYQTARMRAADIERRAALGNTLLSGNTERQLAQTGQQNQVSQYNTTLQEQKRQFDERNRLEQEQQTLREQEFAWEQQQKNLATQQAAGYRYQTGRGGYQPLPQYMKSGLGDYRETIGWGPDQSGPTGTPERTYY